MAVVETKARVKPACSIVVQSYPDSSSWAAPFGGCTRIGQIVVPPERRPNALVPVVFPDEETQPPLWGCALVAYSELLRDRPSARTLIYRLPVDWNELLVVIVEWPWGAMLAQLHTRRTDLRRA